MGKAALSRSEYPLHESKEGEAIQMFRAMSDTDGCEDADLAPVVHYLRGCRALEIPEEWRAVLPTRL